MVHLQLEGRLAETVQQLVPGVDIESLRVRPCANPKFGDYQASGLLGLAKARGLDPRTLAQQVASQLEVGEWCDVVEVAGGGFLNFRLRPAAVVRALAEEAARGGCFLRPTRKPRTIVVDFSSPNIAKPMHVGHIRSTILGDCLSRTLRALGHRVIADNHIGDWGTQFGKLIVGWRRYLDPSRLAADPLSEMERLYRRVNEECDKDPLVLEASRLELVRLQSGDEENRAIWRQMTEVSRQEFDKIYARLRVAFDHTLGESFYNPQLIEVVRELVECGLARESEGALVVFFEDRADLKAHPAIIRKSDGAANYMTTDLATLRYRWATWRPDEILYVTGGPQQLHFRQVFEIFRRWHPEAAVRMEHVWFGSILSAEGKPFRTRSGETVRLADLLDEAEERAFLVVSEKSPALGEADRREIARIVGVGAVKYADLLPNRQSDYTFDWGRMLAMNGNTSPYLQYAYTRVQSLFRRAGVAPPTDVPLALPTEAEELELAKQLMNFSLVLDAVAAEHRPNHLCNYLYELAGLFARFWERCPILRVEGDQRALRLVLSHLTARVLQQGLDLLGIETSDRM